MIEWNAMNKKKSALYECMWGSKEFDFPVEKTVYKGKVTDNSYTFANTANTTEDECRDALHCYLFWGLLHILTFRQGESTQYYIKHFLFY